MQGNHILLAVLWIVYCVMHSVFASLPVKKKFQQKLGKYYKHYRLAYTVFAFIGLIAIAWFQFSIHSINLFSPTLFTKICGGFVALSGLLIMLICIKKYFMGLSGLRSLMREESHSELHVSGIHRYVRHPLYLGTFLFIWGLFILFPTVSLFISNSVITVYTLIGINLEEKKLALDFGDQYKAYQGSVPKLLPKFWVVEKFLHGHRQNKSIHR